MNKFMNGWRLYERLYADIIQGEQNYERKKYYTTRGVIWLFPERNKQLLYNNIFYLYTVLFLL